MKTVIEMALEAGFEAYRGHRGVLDHRVPEDIFAAAVNITEELECFAELVRADERSKPEQEPPFAVQQAYAMAQVCLDLHEALGCRRGDNPYLAIANLRETQPQPAHQLDDIDVVDLAPPPREWIGLTPQDYADIFKVARTGEHAVQLAEKILRENNVEK